MSKTPTREAELQARLDQLRGWGLLTCRGLWAQVDPDNIRDSYLQVLPALTEVHRVQVIESLDAVDRYMFLKAAEQGLDYRVTWREDNPGRPLTTGTGRNASEYLAKTPLVVLNRIKRGRGPARSMLVGLNYLGRLFGSEPHSLARTVMLQRVVRGD